MIKVSKIANGILFDLTTEPGAGEDKALYVFRPSVFHTITRVAVYNDRIFYTTSEDQD